MHRGGHIRKGRTYLIYVSDGKLLRAGDRRRRIGQISWGEENAIVRKTDRWKLPPSPSEFATTEAEFEAAQARWRAAGISNYSFGWRDRGAVLIAPRCADAVIRVRVEAGEGTRPVVETGTTNCPRGKRDTGMNVPTSIDAAFEQMGRLVDMGADQVRIHAAYDPATGVPLAFYAEKLKTYDNDEGFEIMGFEVAKP